MTIHINREVPLTKLQILGNAYGMTTEQMYESSIMDGISPGICINPDCEYTTDVEPDCTDGWCENCNTESVRSALSLGGLL
jgi:hypothetical protein